MLMEERTVGPQSILVKVMFNISTPLHLGIHAKTVLLLCIHTTLSELTNILTWNL